MRKTKFYQFRQNNSGGYIVLDKKLGIGGNIWIEEVSQKRAVEKLKKLGLKYGKKAFYDYCECCGERWDFCASDVKDNEKDIVAYCGAGYQAVVHLLNNSIKHIKKR